MEADTVLFIISGACALGAAGLALYLALTRRHGRTYKEILRQETEFFDALSTTLGLAQTPTATPATPAGPGETRRLTAAPASREPWAASAQTRTQGLEPPASDAWAPSAQTRTAASEPPAPKNFDPAPLEGRYTIKSELTGAGMSRVFLAENVKLGNEWIIKFVPHGELANEEHILKLLNHTGLPRIADIFHGRQGVYLVESYIEGVSLEKVLRAGLPLNQAVIQDWAEQLAQALAYLHGLAQPVLHLDLKPSNIMVTHDNRLVLIDFGISRPVGAEGPLAGVTYQYAAPEQLKHRIPAEFLELVQTRMGTLPASRFFWTPDARTDLYSLGVILFELAAGEPPTPFNGRLLRGAVSSELEALILKAIALDPAERWQTAREVLAALQRSRASRVRMAGLLLARRLAALGSSVLVAASGGGAAGGYYLYTQEAAALLAVQPEKITVSLQQFAQVTVDKHLPGGKVVPLNLARVAWTLARDSVARVDGDRVQGVNLGETRLTGRYRGKEIALEVKVVPPMDGWVEISQTYRLGRVVARYAGTEARARQDGPLGAAEFVSPASLDQAEDGALYLADAGTLRKIKDGAVESVLFQPAHLTARLVRCHNNSVYILTDPWQDGQGTWYGLIRLAGDQAEGLYRADAKYTAVEDFALAPDGRVYFIDRNAGAGKTFLKTLDPANPESLRVLCELPAGAAALALGPAGEVYLADGETGALHLYREGTGLEFFAGAEGERAFVDGAMPFFYAPLRLRYAEGWLYVWDFNTLRRLAVTLQGGSPVAGAAETLAGAASPDFALAPAGDVWPAEDVVLPNSKLAEFVVEKDGKVVVTDPKRGVVWRVE